MLLRFGFDPKTKRFSIGKVNGLIDVELLRVADERIKRLRNDSLNFDPVIQKILSENREYVCVWFAKTFYNLIDSFV